MAKTAVIYIHGKGGNAVEVERYKKFFPECEVLGFDYKSQTPWEAEKESAEYFDDIVKRYKSVVLIEDNLRNLMF